MEDAGTGKERHTKREVHAGKGGERMKRNRDDKTRQEKSFCPKDAARFLR